MRVAGLATGLPPHRLRQEDVLPLAREIYGGKVDEFERLSQVFATSGVRERALAVDPDWFRTQHGWSEKASVFVDVGERLLAQVAEKALIDAGRRPQDVAAVVMVSSTGVATPTLDARLVTSLDLPVGVVRLPIFGLGCVGGVLGLARAATLAEAMPGKPVLLLVVELCSLAFRHGDLDKSAIVAAALFGDGAAAVVLEAGQGRGPRLGARGEHTWPESLDIMGWRVEEDGLGVIFARSIPSLVAAGLRPVADAFLDAAETPVGTLEGLVAHPGGPKVLEALAGAFPECPGGLDEAGEVLAAHGNMSAPTVLFVLDELMRQGRRGRHLMTALGPGFTAGFLLVEL